MYCCSLRLPDEYPFRRQVAKLRGNEHEALRRVLRNVEDHERIRQVPAITSRTNSVDSDFVLFKDVVEKVAEQQGSARVHWVLKGYTGELRESTRVRRRS